MTLMDFLKKVSITYGKANWAQLFAKAWTKLFQLPTVKRTPDMCRLILKLNVSITYGKANIVPSVVTMKFLKFQLPTVKRTCLHKK